jgi:hypothetical protein
MNAHTLKREIIYKMKFQGKTFPVQLVLKKRYKKDALQIYIAGIKAR